MAENSPRTGRAEGRRRGGLTGALSYWLWRRWRSGGPRQEPVRQRSLEQGHEENTGNTAGVLIAALLVVLLVAVSVWGVVQFENRMGGRAASAGVKADLQTTDLGTQAGVPPPRLQADPAIDLQGLHRYEHERLYTYGRLDSVRLHIPIGRAMKLIARRGLPADSSADDGTRRVPTESGFATVRRRFPSEPPAYLGSSPEPYTPASTFRRRLMTGESYLPRPDSAR